MEKHYLVVNSFTGLMGFKIVKGDIGVPGDSASPETWDAIRAQVEAGNLRAIGEGEHGRGPVTRFDQEGDNVTKPGVVDISHWNTIIGDSYSAAVSSLQRTKDSGVVGFIHKATENDSYTDDMLKYRSDLCRDVGLKFGTYHFLRAGGMGEQVAFYYDTVMSIQQHEGEASEWLFVCDYEDPSVPLSDVADFMDQLDAVTGAYQHPVLYTGFALKDKIKAGQDASRLHKYALWLAHYSTEPTLPPGWDRYFLWQYSDKASVPGIQAPTDVNAFDGTAEELEAQWVAPTAAGTTPETPIPEEPERRRDTGGGRASASGATGPNQTYTTTITITSNAPMTAEVD